MIRGDGSANSLMFVSIELCNAEMTVLNIFYQHKLTTGSSSYLRTYSCYPQSAAGNASAVRGVIDYLTYITTSYNAYQPTYM